MNPLRQRLREAFPTREALVVLLFSGAGILASLGTNRLVTQTVAPSVMGQFYLLMNLATWITVPTASTFIYICRHWAVARDEGRAPRFLRSLALGLVLQAGLAIVVSLVFWLLGIGIHGVIGITALVMTSTGQAAAQAVTPLFGMSRRRIAAGCLDLLNTPTRQLALAIGGFCAVGTGEALLGVQAVYFLVYVIVIYLSARWLLGQHADIRTVVSPSTPQLRLSSVLSYSWPFLVTAIATQLSASAERWGLAARADTSSIAIFVQAVGLSTAACGVSTGFLATYYNPLITDAAAAGPEPLRQAARHIRPYLAITCISLMALVAVFAVGAPILTSVFFGAKYAAVNGLLPWTTLGAALFCAGQALFMVPYVVRDSLGPNVIRVVTLVSYATALCLYSPGANAALEYSKLYATAQFFYLVLMGFLVVSHLRRDSRLLPSTATLRSGDAS